MNDATRRALTPLAALALAAAGAPLALADTTREGTVRHDPVRVTVSRAHAGPGPNLPDLVYGGDRLRSGVAEVLADPDLSGRTVSVRVDGGAVVAVEARARADVPVLDRPGLGGELLARPRLDSTLLVVGRATVAGPTGAQDWLRVRSRGRVGYVLADQLEVAESSRVGRFFGELLAPVFGAGSRARGARFFHPDGHTYRAVVTAGPTGRFAETAARLEGDALIRLGLGLHRLRDPDDDPMFDALSLAIRFYDGGLEPGPEVRPGDQDLLVTAWAERFHHFFWKVPFVGSTTDFLANDYFPAMPYAVEGEDVWLRVVPDRSPRASVDAPEDANRIERLDAQIAADAARFHLEVQLDDEDESWHRLAEIRFVEPVDVDQDALHYSANLQGRGLHPRGVVAAMRGAVYRASQDGRAEAEEHRGAADALSATARD